MCDKHYNPTSMREWIQHLANVLHQDFSGDRGWHAREQRAYPMHEAVYKAVEAARPLNWHQLVLEWPHVSTTDPHRLAYTRDDRAGRDNKQTVTTIGRYLTRHFPTLHDHQIRDITALYSAAGCEIIRTMDEMLDTLARGPRSCMQWDNAHSEYHPYRTYDPALGWGMARRVINGDVIGRALVLEIQEGSENTKCYVRSYRKTEGYSPADEILEAWLKDQGYEHRNRWPLGTRLRYIESEYSGSFVAPYLDGENQQVDVKRTSDGDYVLRISEDGEHVCNNTNGVPEDNETREYCEDCNDYYHEDSMCWVDADEDRRVCEDCRSSSYVYARSVNRRRRYIHEGDVIYVESQEEHYDTNYLEDNGIVQLEDGDYVHEDNAWCCEHSNDWYHNSVEYLEVTDEHGDEIKIHPQYAYAYKTDDENEGEE